MSTLIDIGVLAASTILSHAAGQVVSNACDNTFDKWEKELRKKNRRRFLFFGSKNNNTVGIRK